MSMNRRQALGQILKISGAAAGGMAVSSTNVFAADPIAPWDGTPLTYVKLDPYAVAGKAFAAGFGCMNEVFSSIVTSLAETEGPDQDQWANIPVAMGRYGWAGILGEGTTCGNINATGMFLNMVKVPGFNDDKAVSTALMSKIVNYYEQTELPINDEAFLKAALGDAYTETWYAEKVGTPTIATSPLCHSSLTNWTRANSKTMSEKGPRCSLLSANMAFYIVTQLNKMVDEPSTVPAGLLDNTAETQSCQSCHNPGQTGALMVKSNMECDTCHGGH